MARAEIRQSAVLLDTNAIIESVRTGIWNALRGGLRLETVEECHNETQNGNPHRPGRVTVSAVELSGFSAVHPVSKLERAAFALQYAGALDMDAGERDLMAHAFTRLGRGDDVWVVCSPDRASVRAAVALGWRERMVSLEDLSGAVGARPRPALAGHFSRRWLSDCWTEYLMAG